MSKKIIVAGIDDDNIADVEIFINYRKCTRGSDKKWWLCMAGDFTWDMPCIDLFGMLNWLKENRPDLLEQCGLEEQDEGEALSVLRANIQRGNHDIIKTDRSAWDTGEARDE